MSLEHATPPTAEESVNNKPQQGAGDVEGARYEREWQVKSTPWMLGLVVFLTAVFVLATILGAVTVRTDFQTERSSHVDTALTDLRRIVEESPPNARFEAARFLTLASLDARLIELRHHRTASTILASIWTRFMGYLTGMILALIGAIFVLGRIRDPAATTVGGGQQGFQASMTTTWPGLILVVLGSLLMLASSRVGTSGSQQEAPIYTQRWLSPSSEGAVGEAPREEASPPDSDTDVFPRDSGDEPPSKNGVPSP